MVQLSKVRLCRCVLTQMCGVLKLIDLEMLGRNHRLCRDSLNANMWSESKIVPNIRFS